MNLSHNIRIRFILLTIIFTTYITKLQSSEILAIYILGTRSHLTTFVPYLHELTKSGHNVTLITSFKGTLKTTIDTQASQIKINEINGPSLEEIVGEGALNAIQMKINKRPDWYIFWDMLSICRVYNGLPVIQKLAKESKSSFDLVIMDSYINECFYGFASQFDVPIILTSSLSPAGWTTSNLGSPILPAINPFRMLEMEFNTSMNFIERLQNWFVHIISTVIIRRFIYGKIVESLYKEYFPKALSIDEIEINNVSLILANSHFVIDGSKPFLPDVIQIGGIQCRKAKALSKELEEFINGRNNSEPNKGFIYMSFGSAVKTKHLPIWFINLVLNTFRKLQEYQILLKLDSKELHEKVAEIPSNVMLSTWFPQLDLLGHPKLRLFINHGGYASIQETIYFGIPTIGIPIFADQPSTMVFTVENGIGIKLDFLKLTEHDFYGAILNVLSNSKFQTDAKELQSKFRDNLNQPMDIALYWTEYVLRHKGAKHLRSKTARELNFVQYYSIDSMFIVLIIIFMVLKISCCILRACCKFTSKRSRSNNKLIFTNKKKNM